LHKPIEVSTEIRRFQQYDRAFKRLDCHIKNPAGEFPCWVLDKTVEAVKGAVALLESSNFRRHLK
jgi:hypothetical protein